MATPTTQLERLSTEERVLSQARSLLEELGSPRAFEPLALDAHLERDLALGSLERVELVTRLSAEFRAALPDAVAADAETLADLARAVLSPQRIPAEAGAAVAPAPRPPSAVPGTPGPLPEAQTLLDVFAHRGTVDAARPHIFLREDNAPEPPGGYAAGTTHRREITFGELYDSARAVARGLRARGLEPGQSVALMLPTSSDFFVSFAGVLLAGGVAVPIYPPMRADRIQEYAERQSAILRSAEARFLITFRQAEAVAQLLRPHVPSLRGVVTVPRLAQTANGSGDAPIHTARPGDLAFLQYTSGSTGEPKGVMLTHANLLTNIRSITEAVGFNTQDVGLSWLPLYHDMGLIGAWLSIHYFGLPLVVMSPLAFLTRPERWLWAAHHHRGSVTAAPNFAFELCVRKIRDEQIEGLDLSSMRAVLNGAEPVNPRTLDRFCERFARYGFRPEAMLPVYGLAEATLAVTVPVLASSEEFRGHRVDRIDRETFERDGRAVPAEPDAENGLEFVSVGRPVPTYEVRISAADGSEAPERTEGDLWFRGPAATQGYYHNAAATKELHKGDGWVDSGDRAYIAEGDVFITGRVKDIIIKAGRNIYPQEVEETAGGVEGVRRGCVAAFGVADPDAGTERMVVVAELRDAGADTAARAHIELQVNARVTDAVGLPPDVIELVAPGSIPKTSSGKLRRSETKKLYLAGRLATRRVPAWLQVARLAAQGGVRVARSTAERVFEVAYGIYGLLAFAVFLLPTWTLAYFAPSRASASRVTQIGTRILFRMLFVPIEVRGWEHVREGRPFVFVANHTSFLDVILFLALFKFPYRFVSKKEVASWPFIGTFIRRRDDFAFEREDRTARLAQAEALERSLRENVSLLIFPEGTFVANEGVRPFQLGAFKAALATGRGVVPVAIRGVRRILRDGTTLPRPGRIAVTILPPLEPRRAAAGMSSDQATRHDFREIIRLRDAARAAVAEHSGEHLL